MKSLGVDSEDSSELMTRLDEVVRGRNIVHPNAARGAGTSKSCQNRCNCSEPATRAVAAIRAVKPCLPR